MRRYLTRFLIFLLTITIGTGLAKVWHIMALDIAIPTALVTHKGGRLPLPWIDSQGNTCFEEDPWVKVSTVFVSLPNDYEIYIGKNKVELSEVTNEVVDLLKYKCKRDVFVKIQNDVRYATVDSVVDEIRQARVDFIWVARNRKKVR